MTQSNKVQQRIQQKMQTATNKQKKDATNLAMPG